MGLLLVRSSPGAGSRPPVSGDGGRATAGSVGWNGRRRYIPLSWPAGRAFAPTHGMATGRLFNALTPLLSRRERCFDMRVGMSRATRHPSTLGDCLKGVKQCSRTIVSRCSCDAYAASCPESIRKRVGQQSDLRVCFNSMPSVLMACGVSGIAGCQLAWHPAARGRHSHLSTARGRPQDRSHEDS